MLKAYEALHLPLRGIVVSILDAGGIQESPVGYKAMKKITQNFSLRKLHFSVLLAISLWSALSLAEESSLTSTETVKPYNESTEVAVEPDLDTGQTDAVLQELIQLLDQETELATKIIEVIMIKNRG